MIEVDLKEFRGDHGLLARLLQERLKVEVRVERRMLRVGSADPQSVHPSLQQVKDSVKRVLHHMRLDGYHVVAQAGVLSIRERKTHERRIGRKGSAPSVRQTVPYFFPG